MIASNTSLVLFQIISSSSPYSSTIYLMIKSFILFCFKHLTILTISLWWISRLWSAKSPGWLRPAQQKRTSTARPWCCWEARKAGEVEGEIEKNYETKYNPKSTILTANTRAFKTTKQTKPRPIASAASHPIIGGGGEIGDIVITIRRPRWKKKLQKGRFLLSPQA